MEYRKNSIFQGIFFLKMSELVFSAIFLQCQKVF